MTEQKHIKTPIDVGDSGVEDVFSGGRFLTWLLTSIQVQVQITSYFCYFLSGSMHEWKFKDISSITMLTHCGLVTPYGGIDLGQHWLRKWLVAWRHQAITWTNVDLSSIRYSDIHWRTTSNLSHQWPKLAGKLLIWIFFYNLPGTNELIHRTETFCNQISESSHIYGTLCQIYINQSRVKACVPGWCSWRNHDMVLQWRHNGRDSVANRQPRDCFLSHLLRHRSNKTPKLRVTGLCAGNSQGTGEFPHKWPVTRKMLPFDDVIMTWSCLYHHSSTSFRLCSS